MRRLLKLNHNLAIAAEATGVALAVGSQRVLLARSSAASGFAYAHRRLMRS